MYDFCYIVPYMVCSRVVANYCVVDSAYYTNIQYFTLHNVHYVISVRMSLSLSLSVSLSLHIYIYIYMFTYTQTST